MKVTCTLTENGGALFKCECEGLQPLEVAAFPAAAEADEQPSFDFDRIAAQLNSPDHPDTTAEELAEAVETAYLEAAGAKPKAKKNGKKKPAAEPEAPTEETEESTETGNAQDGDS